MPTSFPSFGIPYGYKRILRVNVEQIRKLDLTLDRIWRNRHIQHAFEIPWQALTSANRVTLLAFFDTCRGRMQSDIAFTDPFDSVSYTCRLNADVLDLSAPEIVAWAVPVRLVEISSFKSLKAAVDPFPASVPFQQYSHAVRYGTAIEAQEDDHEHAYEDFGAPVRRWKAGGQALTLDQASDLIEAWEGSGGPWKAFSFTDPEDDDTYDAHFADPEIVCQSVAPGVWSCEAIIEELL